MGNSWNEQVIIYLRNWATTIGAVINEAAVAKKSWNGKVIYFLKIIKEK